MFFGQTKTCLFLGWPNPSRPNQPKRDMFWFGRQSILLLFIRYACTKSLMYYFFPFLDQFAVGHSLWLPSQVVVANNPIKRIQCIQSQISHRDLVVKISVHSIEVYWVLGRFLNTRGEETQHAAL